MARVLDVTRIRTRVSELLAAYRIPSAAIGVLIDGEITDFAVGVKDISTREPATTGTVYQCGSVSKTWTALAFMQLVDEGKVAMDEPVRTYLPEFRVADPDVSAKVTPRHLLNHTSGIEESYGEPGEDDDVYQRMVENVAGACQVHPLGHTHGYSAALGYAILARIMEVTDGERWDDIMKDRLFDPLGLISTTTRREYADHDQAATGYLIRSLEEGPIPSPLGHLPRAFGPGGNINTTARDLLTMAYVFLNEGKAPNGTRIVSPGIIREMTESRVPIPDPYMFGPEWALGLIVCDWHGETVYAHDGSAVSQSARLRILPESNIAVSMLTNAGPRDSFYRKVFNTILADLGTTTIPALPEPDPALALDPSRYEGSYGRPGIRYEVAAEHGELHLRFTLNPMEAQLLDKPEQLDHELSPISETHFLMPSDDPVEDPQTVAIYDFENGAAHYLHINGRVHPRVDEEGATVHVMAVSTISDRDGFWNRLKQAFGRLPQGARWTLAVASADGSKAVNVIVHDSIDGVRSFFEDHTAGFATTEYFEADASNAVGLPT
ncbi:beta-lactamase family protein [Nonomuraea sp. KC401]|uniref:serine hydrolase domain-containing protein n=1 Tax=unclassified Nonomuraea TaxID=2593643 RepID=UPI0010FE658C|nr:MULTISPECIES: serine hydrolase domain-containing protein [unclassified Nonomuraea]NBE97082.1 serine hydrolase [Nonomuraea sp. K271]TLF66145.1 beta-lactamase family protein [Nonomuraea sp. KC401]